jgi:seryl-tRNA(Sec) selenium transferase
MASEVVKTIQQQVAEQIAKCAPQVESQVVDMLVDQEIQKRVPAIKQGVERHAELFAEQKKQDKPDIVSRDREGKVVSEFFSAKKIEELKKLDEQIRKLEQAIEKAFSNGDVKDLNVLLQQGKNTAKGGAGDSKETPPETV